MSYEMVAGLETHIELSTNTKIFCGCTTQFGAEPNTNCCPICIGLPGTLPKLNRRVVEYAVMAGIATNCEISEISKMDRKNYVYPDLSKAYQVSQYDRPLCRRGHITLSSGKRINITRIHIEEDAGKLLHERGDTYVDYNRGGVPLIEVVTEPDIRSIDEALEYVEKLQLIMKYIGVSDVKMQEGSLRCDVNISVRKEGEETLGIRAEIKNMNSFAFMAKALQYEFERQIDLLESGERVVQETRRYNTETGETEAMRGKEDAHDYRYFREPDLVTIQTLPEEIARLGEMLPELPDQRLARYVLDYGIPEADAQLIVKYRRVAEFFDTVVVKVQNPKTVSNFIVGQIFKELSTEVAREELALKITADMLIELVKLLEGGKINMGIAKKTLDTMLNTGKNVSELLSREDMAGIDEEALRGFCQAAIDANASAVQDYLGGKEKALKSILGNVMRETKGRADALAAEKLLSEMIKNQ
ncbi:MAG: Asp-tRNA(Asn)/Glu-tRNA(Gln) amidotransferase subunit GatB [Acetanaerobacterium sp.]